jgi:uncharacterized protein (DUF58 family)
MARIPRWPPLAASKDPADYPGFPGAISRWIWRIFTQRFTTPGRWFAAASAMLAGYGGISHSIQIYVIAIYVAGIWLVAFAAMALFRPRARLTTKFTDRVCAGETLEVEVDLEQQSRFRGADLLVVPHRLPESIDAIPPDGLRVRDVSRGQRQTTIIPLQCRARGRYVLKGFRLESDFPFGLLRSRRIFSHEDSLIVYPKFTALARLDIPIGRRYQPGGVALVSQLGESFEYLGNREYRDGDNVRDIDWRTTARAQRPIVREWVQEYMLRAAVILDTHIPRPSAIGSIFPRRKTTDPQLGFERAVSLAAAVSDYMARQDYLVDIFAAGPNLYHLTAGRSLAYLDQILDILACVDSNPKEPFDIIEPQIEELIERLSTVVCLFLDWNQTRWDFAMRLRSHGVAVKCIVCRDAPCTLDPAGAVSAFGPIPVISESQFERGVTTL